MENLSILLRFVVESHNITKTFKLIKIFLIRHQNNAAKRISPVKKIERDSNSFGRKLLTRDDK